MIEQREKKHAEESKEVLEACHLVKQERVLSSKRYEVNGSPTNIVKTITC